MVETGEREETTGKAAGIFLIVFALYSYFAGGGENPRRGEKSQPKQTAV